MPNERVDLTFRCVEAKSKTDEYGKFSYSALLSAVDEHGRAIDPRKGFPAKGTVHYAVNGELPYPAIEEGKLYRVSFEEVEAVPEPEPETQPTPAPTVDSDA